MESKIGNDTMYLVEDITRRLNGETKVRRINYDNKTDNRSVTRYLLVYNQQWEHKNNA